MQEIKQTQETENYPLSFARALNKKSFFRRGKVTKLQRFQLLSETHLVLVGVLLVANRQVGSVHVQVDVVVTSDAPAALLGRRHPLELHMGVMALLPLLPGSGQAVDSPIHIHCPKQGGRHGCTGILQRQGERVNADNVASALPAQCTTKIKYMIFICYFQRALGCFFICRLYY